MLFYIVIVFFPITLLFLLLFYKFWFLRNPSINVSDDNHIVSPADGKVLKIIEYKHGKDVDIFKKDRKFSATTRDVSGNGYIIIIVMNIFNIHWQKAPLSGKVISVKYKKGKFLNAVFGAKNMNATTKNERNEILIETPRGKIKIIQIAGIIARRICCFVKEGQEIQKGQDLGLIKLGSQVVIILPNIKLKVKEGDNIRVGKTIIA